MIASPIFLGSSVSRSSPRNSRVCKLRRSWREALQKLCGGKSWFRPWFLLWGSRWYYIILPTLFVGRLPTIPGSCPEVSCSLFHKNFFTCSWLTKGLDAAGRRLQRSCSRWSQSTLPPGLGVSWRIWLRNKDLLGGVGCGGSDWLGVMHEDV